MVRQTAAREWEEAERESAERERTERERAEREQARAAAAAEASAAEATALAEQFDALAGALPPLPRDGEQPPSAAHGRPQTREAPPGCTLLAGIHCVDLAGVDVAHLAARTVARRAPVHDDPLRLTAGMRRTEKLPQRMHDVLQCAGELDGRQPPKYNLLHSMQGCDEQNPHWD